MPDKGCVHNMENDIPMDDYSIEVKGLEKSYGEIQALKKLSFCVGKAELFGLIGPDGAGKSSLFRILTTLMRPDSGEAFIDGLDIKKDFKKIRSRLGYMPGRFSLYQDLSVEENLNFFATIFGTSIEENYHLIADIYKHIEPFKKRQAGKLSGGMKQKLALSCALIHHPSVLFLDEPTTGVDAVSRKEFWDMLKKLKREGITIMVSTPYMDEAILCDRVALLQKGSIMGIDTPEGIINAYPKELFAIKSMDTYDLLKDLREHPDCYSAFSFGGSVHFSSSGGRDLRAVLYEYLVSLGHQNVSVEPQKAGIEDCFMYLMSKNSAQ